MQDTNISAANTKRHYQQTRIAHWNTVTQNKSTHHQLGRTYHKYLRKIYRYLVPANARILEIGCGEGDLLSSLNPLYGVGIDFSKEMISRAQDKYPDLQFIQQDAHDLSTLNSSFDVIILSDLVNDLWDVQEVLTQLKLLASKETRIIINTYSRLWEVPLRIAQKLKLATPMLTQNWLTPEDIKNLLNLAGFETIRQWQDILFPFSIPLLTPFANRFLGRFWPFREMSWTNFIVANAKTVPLPHEASVSVIIPARNEEGNIATIFERVPKIGKETELIFVEGHSKDNTFTTIEKEIKSHPEIRSLVYKQSGKGKADAVRLGFQKASGEILMILDADMTVPPEDLPRFYDALVNGKGEFINGVRLIYPMEDQAMRTLNLLGNKFFSLAFSWILGQPIKDTLCGTKVLWADSYQKIAANRSYFGDFDPFGDFDLIFGAAKLNLKIVDLPIRYRERTYGDTNISRWRHGWLLLRMVWFAARRIKFI